MPRVQNGISTRDSCRKGNPPLHATRHVPALSTQEAAALVLGVIKTQLQDGRSLEQIGWQRYCRDSAVVQVVTQQLAYITEEVSP